MFDSWAGSLKGADFDDFALKPVKRIIAALKDRHPGLPIIAFPREAKDRYEGFARATGADCGGAGQFGRCHLGGACAGRWLRRQPCAASSGHGRPAAGHATREIVRYFGGPHIFNLGHGITPDADPDNVRLMIETVRGAKPA